MYILKLFQCEHVNETNQAHSSELNFIIFIYERDKIATKKRIRNRSSSLEVVDVDGVDVTGAGAPSPGQCRVDARRACVHNYLPHAEAGFVQAARYAPVSGKVGRRRSFEPAFLCVKFEQELLDAKQRTFVKHRDERFPFGLLDVDL